MSTNRRVRKFEDYEDAAYEKARHLSKHRDDILGGRHKVKVKLRPDGSYDLISYDVRKKDDDYSEAKSDV